MPAEFNGPGDELFSNTQSLKHRHHDKPAQSGSFGRGLASVDGHRTGKHMVSLGHPQAVPGFIKFLDKIRQFAALLGFEGHIKSPVLVIINGVYFGDFADDPWIITAIFSFLHR